MSSPAVAAPFPSQLELLSASSALKRFCEGNLEPSEIKALVVAAEAHHDLLAALKELTDALRIHAPGTKLNNHQFDALGMKCNAAIAKAEGR